MHAAVAGKMRKATLVVLVMATAKSDVPSATAQVKLTTTIKTPAVG
jgi:hypothetical protein